MEKGLKEQVEVLDQVLKIIAHGSEKYVLTDQEKEFFARYLIGREKPADILKDNPEIAPSETAFFGDSGRGKTRGEIKAFFQTQIVDRFNVPEIKKGFKSFENFLSWWVAQDFRCYYCEIDGITTERVFEQHKIKSKRFNGTLHIDRKDPDGGYSGDNCVLACSLCNNAKSDMIGADDFKQYIASGIWDYWIRLKGTVYVSFLLCSQAEDDWRSGFLTLLMPCVNASDHRFSYIANAKDIWLRDFMPVKTRDGRYVSFRYEPSYLQDSPELRTDYLRDLENEVRERVGIEVEYCDINLDGGNVVMSPSKATAIVSDRIFAENPEREPEALVAELERVLAARVIIIPALKSDMTGHADGMVRFVDETTVIGNATPYKNGHEQKIKSVLKRHGIRVIDFPYFESCGISAEGTYLNFLETDDTIFLPVFGHRTDAEAIAAAKHIFPKAIVPVRCDELAKEGGCLNCISWES